jgi:hypothetical protein
VTELSAKPFSADAFEKALLVLSERLRRQRLALFKFV